MEINKVYLGDCLDIMPNFPDNSIDMVLCDLPYGTTGCKWDTIIPFEPLWGQYKRIIKKGGVIVLTSSQPFTSQLINSNIKNFKYELIWDKIIPSGMSYARYQPMRQHESISIFSYGKNIYNPQMIKRDKPIKSSGSGNLKGGEANIRPGSVYKKLNKTYDYKFPTSILKFDKVRKDSLHPTQKPVPLFEYLINTYTKENDLILDNCAGSGTTGIACLNTKRNYILIEKEEKFYNIINERLRKHLLPIK